MESIDTNQALALLQARVLSRMFCDRVHSLALKGGMAMRVAHEHARHTKDIDIDADPLWPLHRLQRMVRRAIHEAIADDILMDVVVSEPKQTHTTARWKINGVVPATGAALHLTVEISLRHSIDADDIREVEYQVPGDMSPSNIPVYRDERLLINKVHSLMSETRHAPRDVVDLFLLFDSGVSIESEDVADVVHGDPEAAIRLLWDKLEAMDETQFQQEVLPIWNVPADKPQWQDWTDIRTMVGLRLEEIFRGEATHASHGIKS
jgi:hypothetical protein